MAAIEEMHQEYGYWKGRLSTYHKKFQINEERLEILPRFDSRLVEANSRVFSSKAYKV